MLFQHDLAAETAAARKIFREKGREFSAGEEFSRLLAAYAAEIEKTGALLAKHGVEEFCKNCDLELDGCCCFAGVEKWYDRKLILLNLFLGAEIPERKPGGVDDCFFKGPAGCALPARCSTCLGYYCLDLQNMLGSSRLAEIRRQVGAEILCGIAAENALDLQRD